MCGIAGRFEFEGPVDARLVQAMTDAIAHRGPDDQGLLVRGGCALGHRRLSIVDLAGGHQPMSNEDGTVWVAFNGEIYDHASIRRDLEAKGHVFQTRSDTEVIVHAYEEDGPRCVHRFRGMFAFALWDTRRRRLVLARDRLGIKPVYYALGRGRVTFASEVRPLLLDAEVDRSVDEDALSTYLALRYVPAPRTLLAGVRKLPPGSLLIAENGQARVERYWDLAEQPTVDDRPPTEADAAVRFRELMDDAVEMRLMSEVPLGAFLSGGVDSTAVVASMMARHQGERVKTFAVGYDDESVDSELSWAAMAAHALGTEHHEVHLGAAEAARELPRIVWDLDEPIADPASVPLWFLARKTREHVTVVLSGEGGDEILGGYASYRWMSLMERMRATGLGLAAGLGARFLPTARLRRAARLVGMPLEARYRGVSRAFDDPGRHRLRGGVDLAGDRAVAEALAPLWDKTRGMTPLRRMIYLDTSVWLPDDLLMKADKMTMATAIELRVPLLDHRLVEHAWSLPDRFKVQGSEGKRILRQAVRARIPRPILDRPKKGFATPTGAWLRRALRPLVDEVLLDGSAARELDAGYVRELVATHGRGDDRTPELWTLLVLALWRDRLGRFEPLKQEATPQVA